MWKKIIKKVTDGISNACSEAEKADKKEMSLLQTTLENHDGDEKVTKTYKKLTKGEE